jgi:hypothetical protein
MICPTCHGTGWHLHCPEKTAGCPFRCSPRCRFGTCPECQGSGRTYCCDQAGSEDQAAKTPASGADRGEMR